MGQSQKGDINIAALTASAEQGDSCAVRKVFDEIPHWEDRLKLMRQMDTLNAERRAKDPNLPDLFITLAAPLYRPFGANLNWTNVYLNADPPGLGKFNMFNVYHEKQMHSDGRRVVSNPYQCGEK